MPRPVLDAMCAFFEACKRETDRIPLGLALPPALFDRLMVEAGIPGDGNECQLALSDGLVRIRRIEEHNFTAVL